MFPKKRHIHIDGWGWEEGEDDANVSVTVTFPDASRWACNFYTLKNIQTIREHIVNSGNRKYMWGANPLVIVDTISRQHIEDVVDESIQNGTFHIQFEYFGEASEYDRKELPEGFLNSDERINPKIVYRHVGKVRQLLEQSSDAVRETVKHWLFADHDSFMESHTLQFIVTLEDNGIIATMEKGKGQELRDRWGRLFARGMDISARMEIHMEQYLWHLFSYEKLPCLMNEQAEDAFHAQEKQDCYIFYQGREQVLFVANAAKLTADILRHEQDVYVVDRDFTWTYVNTHESDLGPYFYQR
ncbi:DUF4275 family protein [Paenibacillus harenae]|uniref:DUF4275 family protein n=1 Tax=Paenibacillus harenae TaxID=306543 RepID=A0ABT9U1N1_PAEHA|nr:DUF4275 family protein [Paenibacillus harenae]MDQ0112334.1 hypothetical protein [Paenibacillus harenae]